MDVAGKFKDWSSRVLEDPDLTAELAAIRENEKEIYERFYTDLVFGTAGLRGILGAGTNRMNIYTVRRATQGLAAHIQKQKLTGGVAIAYDSRIKSRLFAETAAEVLAGNGISVWLSDDLMATPMLSWAVRYYKCAGGIVVTASHNPAEYNGYKVYDPDGCQMTNEAADAVYAAMLKTDIFEGAARMPFAEAVRRGIVRTIEREANDAYYEKVLACRACGMSLADLTVAFTPLNGSGMKPVAHVFNLAGLKRLHVVKEQAMPDGNFPTCRYPNPEAPEAMRLGLELAKQVDADILIGTDPDGDRIGVAAKKKGEFTLLSGNEVGILLIDYIGSQRTEDSTLPKNPLMIKSIVSSPMADLTAAQYGIDTIDVLTGFKHVGDQIGKLERQGQIDRFVFAYEESCGYLPGVYVRDKDGVAASLLVAQMAAWHKTKGKTLHDVLDDLFARVGWHHDRVENFAFAGANGMKSMKEIMNRLFENQPGEIAGFRVLEVRDYRALRSVRGSEVSVIDSPPSDVLIFLLEKNQRLIIRPSGTEPKLKIYSLASGVNMEEAQKKTFALAQAAAAILGVSNTVK